MNREQFLAEQCGLKQVIPYDMDTVTAHARIGLAKGDRLAIICSFGDSTAAVVDLTLNQHTLVSGGTSKVLATQNPYFKKAGAATAFTKVQPSEDTSNYVLSTDLAAQEGVVVFEVLGEDLDNENGYAFVSLSAADSTAAKILAVTYVLNNVRLAPAYKLDL